MPERLSVFKVDASEIMGEDAYVKIKPITQKQALLRKSNLDQLQRVKAKLEGADTPDYAKIDKVESEMQAMGNQMFVDHVVEWNFVDDEGKPMPLPKDDLTVMDNLYSHEIEWLGEAIGGTASRKK